MRPKCGREAGGASTFLALASAAAACLTPQEAGGIFQPKKRRFAYEMPFAHDFDSNFKYAKITMWY